MNDRRARREGLGLTQPEAATRAGVSLATWRRWEEEPATVRADTQVKCQNVLERGAPHQDQFAKEAAIFEDSWGDSVVLTPRQAYSIASVLAWWADVDLEPWLKDSESRDPMHTLEPFSAFDLRVMIYIDDNRAWAEKARERCLAVSDEIKRGIVPFDRRGCYFDELILGAALRPAQIQLDDLPELFEGIEARPSGARHDEDETEDFWLSDDDWGVVASAFDDRCRWDEWEVPLYNNHPLLSLFLREHHPYSWFDPAGGTGPGSHHE